MGVPVVPLTDTLHAGRLGTDLLTHFGLTNWSAPTPAADLALAVAAANDLGSLAKLRSELRERLRSSPLCDAPRFTRNCKAACVTMAAHQA